MSRPNEETFRIRARALLEEQGAARLARRYGVSESTIRNYAAGRSTPRDASVMRNMTRAGRRITGAAVQVRDSATGRFGVTIADPNMVRYVEVQRARIQTARRVAIEEATTPASRARAESMPSDVDFDLVLDLQRRRQALLRGRVRGDRILNTETGEVLEGDEIAEGLLGEEYDFYDFDYWARWRADLERSYGRI